MKYHVVNDTIKPVVGSKDTRSTLDRVGHPVSFVDADGRHHMLAQHHSGIFVERLTPGMMGLRDDGLLRIKPVEDITAVLKEHTLKKTVKVEKEERKAKAKEMGAEEAPVADEGVNPDGEPNFVVKAKRRKG